MQQEAPIRRGNVQSQEEELTAGEVLERLHQNAELYYRMTGRPVRIVFE